MLSRGNAFFNHLPFTYHLYADYNYFSLVQGEKVRKRGRGKRACDMIRMSDPV